MSNPNCHELYLRKLAPKTDEELLSQILQEQDDTNVVLSVREELMDRVMEECYKSYLKKQTVRFVVQCAYDALVKYLSFNFYYHPEAPDVSQAVWIPDPPIKPSPKDTWAYNAVAIGSADYKDYKNDDRWSFLDSPNSSESNETTINKESKNCSCMEHLCKCLVPPEEINKQQFDTSPGQPPCSKEKLISTFNILENIETDLDLSETSTDLSEQFTEKMIRDGSLAPRVEVKSKIKNKKVTSPQKKIKMEVQETVRNGSQASLFVLPPIRVNSTFYSKPVEKVVTKK
ncbi:hypothetical protein ABEB36_008681 [Hypothenemus hampei]|uniref:Uncharacterized protein n=1 Tax=Hypothenemus hampei TaxID=57062 RepID=A0ABD1EMQ5_HYPHA